MADRWIIVESMVSELGNLCSLEAEASGFPEIAGDPAIRDIHMAVLQATDEMSRLAIARGDDAPGLERAREALETALASATAARRVIAQARALRNHHL